MNDEAIECCACRAELPIVWHVQSKKYMHEAPGLSVTSCARLDARAQRANDVANEYGNEDQRGR